MKKFIDQHAECPNISLRPIDIVDQTLRRHVNRRSNIYILELILRKFREPEICYFCLSFVNKNVRNFEIAMYYIILGEVHQPFKNIANIPISLKLLQILLRPQLTLQIPLITKLSNDIAIAIARKNLMASQYIRMVELFKYIDFREEQLLQFLALEAVELDDLDCDYILWVTLWVLVISLWAL